MNILRKITIYLGLLVLQPSITQGYAGGLLLIHSLFTWLMWVLFVALYFLPSIYYILRYRRCNLSINSLLIPHLAFACLLLMGFYHNELGLAPLLLKLIQYISAAAVFVVFCILSLFSWSYPAFYAYSREIKSQ